MGWSFFINHAIVLLLPPFAWIVAGWRPTVRALWWAYGWFGVYVVVAVTANAMTGGNYLYQREKPVLPMLSGPVYLAATLVACLALFWLGLGISRLVLRLTAGEPERRTDRPALLW